MGPRPFRRGNTLPMKDGWYRLVRCFNGATPLQAWKQPNVTMEQLKGASFNGATPLQTWKPSCCRIVWTSCGRLQWGHAPSGVETPAPEGW